ncbi:hypothetical protein [Nibricoccus sp. IMCC34717]|uniref:hypothetical protein n=1 Tax=Nibricoccus sp. IMCC34717 TaxID=3034021 RepID=UPI0038506169
MSQRTCHYCGIPVRAGRATEAEAVYCCTGCAIAERIPIDSSGQFPVNRALVGTLVIGFLAFNQILFALLSAIAAHQAKATLSGRMAWASLGVGAGVWLALALAMRFSGRRSVAEKLPAAAALGVFLWAGLSQPPALWLAGAGNGILLIWNMRGLLRRRFTKKSDKAV